jgi:hypothetical protein
LTGICHRAQRYRLVRARRKPAADLGAFGFLRGVRDRAVMLELRWKDGSVVAFAYAWLERAGFDPSEGSR